MKELIILLFFTLVVTGIGCSQTSDSNQSRLFKEAFDYIKSSSKAQKFLEGQTEAEIDCIVVSDQVVFLEITSFFEQFADNEEQIDNNTGSQLLDSLEAIDKKRKFETYSDKKLKELTNCKESNAILFFSRPFDQQLMAELFYNRQRDNSPSYSNVSRFNESLMFLISFNESGSIEEVKTTNVIYE